MKIFYLLVLFFDFLLDKDNKMENGTERKHAKNRDRELSLMEKQYLLACERGDVATVREFLSLAGSSSDPASDFDPSCVDPLGRTSLRIAIENENIEMIEVLLEANVETGDCLLYAINEENVEAVEIIVNHLEKLDKFNIETQGVEINEYSAFSPDINPLILAAHRDNYEIIKLFLDRGASIPHPHDVHCSCKDCVEANNEDSLQLTQSRINAYRALTSPSLICLSARDPILYSFELSWELRRLSTIEHQFKLDYLELSQKCQKFAADLLDQTRSSNELATILNYDSSDRWPVQRNIGKRMELSRLKLAIQFRQKKFVAHPNCQQLLASIWYEGLPGYRRRHIIFKLLLILSVSIGFPILSVTYLLAPKSSIGQFVRKPFIKFLCHGASYCTFICIVYCIIILGINFSCLGFVCLCLVLLILASQRINYDLLSAWSTQTGSVKDESGEDPDRKEKRGPAPSVIECAIVAWVVGLIWVEIKQLWDVGLTDYVKNMWNILDFITNSLYISTITLRIIAYIGVENELKNPETAHLGRLLPRRYWNAWDPTLISECVFATANILSSLKMVHLFTVNPHLGPLQISLGRMVIDIIKFFFVYSLVLFAFACGLNQLFWYYASMRRNECDQSDEILLSQEMREDYKTSCNPKFSSFSEYALFLFVSLETLFWSIFGMIDLENFRLKENHAVTEWTGKTMFGTYGVISIIVLLNMLIAMMSNSYQYISNQADTEWKFARSRLWIEYFEESATLPPPFNIIPSPKAIYYVFQWLKELCCRQYSLKKYRSAKKSMRFVMRNLVKRYISQVQHNKQKAETVTEEDINELKQDISSFRYELLSILGQAGFNTGQANSSRRSVLNKRRNAMAERRLLKGFSVDLSNVRRKTAANLSSKRLRDRSETEVFSTEKRQERNEIRAKLKRISQLPIYFTRKITVGKSESQERCLIGTLNANSDRKSSVPLQSNVTVADETAVQNSWKFLSANAEQYSKKYPKAKQLQDEAYQSSMAEQSEPLLPTGKKNKLLHDDLNKFEDTML
ncbi:Transient receptor potential-gamma protein [Trichinella patagoniensis]|uniref:Transient receptor potential-gamma protein n=1 Tax=Trichinella patagoniensis TaxID=990121 RepID=A0A0V1AE71_9BILA|nr:Transient receptor potential-gamma protein [Trichinella patagoniensis]